MSPIFGNVIYANLAPLLSVFFLLALVSYHPTQNRKQTRTFQLAACIEIFMIFIISFDYLFGNIESSQVVPYRQFTSFWNFAMSPLIPLLLYKIFHPDVSSKLLYLPFALNFIICFISIFNGIVFFITNVNTYARGPLFIIPFMSTIFYMGNLIFQREYRYKRNKQIERWLLLASVCVMVFGMILEIVFAFSFLTWDFSILCLFSYYLLLCIHSAILDPLTGSFNRIKYYKMLSSYEHHKNFVIAMLDINDFKLVNDTQGHEAGDRFLIAFVELIEHSLASYASIYRIGGDEFILISRKLNVAQMEEKLLKMKVTANEQQMDFAYGICNYQLNEDVSDLIIEVDKRMYENKKKCKQN